MKIGAVGDGAERNLAPQDIARSKISEHVEDDKFCLASSSQIKRHLRSA